MNTIKRMTWYLWMLGLTLIGTFAQVKAQGGGGTPGDKKNPHFNIPASPNATALEKFAEIPVSLYTGVPNVNVPIYNLSSRHLSVPISLAYHYTGLKPNETPSWVGLGWSLNAGGVITRTIRGKPDETGGVGYYEIKNQLKDEYIYKYAGTNPDSIALAEQEWGFLKSVAEGLYDTQPDVYSFNVAGYTGKFFIEKLSENNYKAYTIPYQNVKIEVLGTFPTGGWKITVPNGTQYIFGGDGTDADGNPINLSEKSSTISTTDGGNPTPGVEGVTAWYLREIKSMNQDDKIEFHYRAASPSNHHQTIYSESRKMFIQGASPYTYTSIEDACRNGVKSVSITSTEVSAINRLHIAKITTQTGHEVVFEEGEDRLDYGDKTLGRVLVQLGLNK